MPLASLMLCCRLVMRYLVKHNACCPWFFIGILGRVSNRKGTSDNNGKPCRIVRILYDQIWVFALHAPLSSEVPVVLLNQPILILTALLNCSLNSLLSYGSLVIVFAHCRHSCFFSVLPVIQWLH